MRTNRILRHISKTGPHSQRTKESTKRLSSMNDPEIQLECSVHLYRPLPSNEFTRIFELEAGELFDPIIGRLVLQTPNGEPYEAVSYVWGDSRKRHNITVNGAVLSVTANLYGALTALRHRPADVKDHGCNEDSVLLQKGPTRRLWADAICITQSDMPERISQVELMSSIFAGARRVLCWLGWEKGKEDRRHAQDAIRFIHSFMKDPDAGLNDARILLIHHDHLADPTEDHAHLTEQDQRRFKEQARKWEAVKFFFEIEYFHRTWIVQELGLAREAVLLTALKPSNESSGVEQEAHISQNVVTASDGYAVEVDRIDWPLLGRFVEFVDYSGASLVTHLGLLLWIVHHILIIWATKPDGTPNCDFLTSMHCARVLRVTDARDRVFGLLGHPRAVLDGELVVHADYTSTRGVIYTRLAVNFIRKTSSLYVVSLVDHEDDPSPQTLKWDPQIDARMPSWVPDWHSINRTTPVYYTVPAAVAEAPDVTIEGSWDGRAGSSLPCLIVRGWVVDQVSAVGHLMKVTDFPITSVAREMTKMNPFWLDRIWKVVFPGDAQSSNSADLGDRALDTLESLSLALPFGT